MRSTFFAFTLLMGCLAWFCGQAAAGDPNFTTLYNFKNEQDGRPSGRLVADDEGVLYGTTGAGGSAGAGTVFKLVPTEDGTWTKTVIYRFKGGTDGSGPLGGMIFDAAGALYGTTQRGGGGN